MHTLPLSDYMERIERDDWPDVGELMLASARKLNAMGAAFLICPDNTIHQALPYIEQRLPLPWLHIAGVVVDEARARGFMRIGIMGTRPLVESPVYPEPLAAAGIECAVPPPAQRDECNRIIMEELTAGVVRAESVSYLLTMIRDFQNAGCDAVVLACTELPLVINDGNSPLPALDSTRLLARAALRRATEAEAV